jgi:hypothetical protein
MKIWRRDSKSLENVLIHEISLPNGKQLWFTFDSDGVACYDLFKGSTIFLNASVHEYIERDPLFTGYVLIQTQFHPTGANSFSFNLYPTVSIWFATGEEAAMFKLRWLGN